jgi:hypothetical protein
MKICVYNQDVRETHAHFIKKIFDRFSLTRGKNGVSCHAIRYGFNTQRLKIFERRY